MAKCPKCSSRKGKRHCPGLDVMICSACCGEHRFTEIPCPEDCTYLGDEPYHQQRRIGRSRSQGRPFLKFLTQAVTNEQQRRFSLRLFMYVFAYNQRNGELTDRDIHSALRDLRQLLGRIVIPGQSPHPLSVQVESQCSSDPDLSTKEGLSADDRVAALEALENAVVRKAGGTTRHISWLLDGFFGPLNLMADLGYDPVTADAESGEFIDPGYRERPSGLIVPP